MSTTQSTQPTLRPPAPQTPPDEPQGGGAAAIIVFLFGIVAWGMAFVAISGADEQDVPATNYALGIALTIVGATLIIAASIYDSRRS